MNNCHCTKELAIFWPPNHVSYENPLIGTNEQFCTAFFHVFPCWEWGIKKHVCLHKDSRNCRHRNVTLIAVTRKFIKGENKKKTTKIARYTNCITKNRAPIHAEEFMIKDQSLLEELSFGSKITIYAQLQPCHHSGGNDSESLDVRSCTDLLLSWYEKTLKPRGIALTIRCANLYKCMWKFAPEEIEHLPLDKCFVNSSTQALEGMKKLIKSDICVTAMSETSWRFLQRKFNNGGKIAIPEEKMEARKELDDAIKKFINDLICSIYYRL